ncbi:DHA2 family efflux MFS transporter permease subunit [Thermoflavimicrobium dichotomicum]|uniref:MFS transporter, DHA2 family, multidrug resistance protein n=1 Tax=Thermoflavimicrobium dichotomicum TaxID=46223 RepID=A0A1I3KIP5_9BACL|nr:DHA2 family efflux MFS transporter permease subunit [Thermoflavimicrobium dichotomicum]SFI72353.1 MFS transporter, DHA2 family, multidrug resistance protein [Thermoflavimicrobium dichotomicum]
MVETAKETTRSEIRKHIPLLAILMCGVFLAVLNQTLLNVAIPHLITEFNVTPTTAQWLLTGYMLTNGILIPMSAFFIERMGARILFIAAMVFFTGGSLICGIAPTFSVMLIGRLVQAVGGGILMPLVMSIILAVFPPEIRGKGMGIFGLGIMFAPAIGPTLSGWVIEHYDWRLLFNGMVPLGIIILVLALFWLRDIKEKRKIPFDFFDAVISTLGFGLVLYGFSRAGTYGWSDQIVLLSLIVGTLFIILFVTKQLRSSHPMLNFYVFRYSMFSLSSLINVIITIAMFSGMFLIPIYLQNLRGFTPLESGLLILPGAVIMGIMSPISGSLFDKIGPRPLCVIGMLITTVTTYEFTHLTLQTSYTYILVLNMIRSFGMSLLMMSVMTAGLNQLPGNMNSHGTAMSNTVRQIAGSIGISVFTTIFSIRTNFHMSKLSEGMNIMDPAFSQTFHSTANQLANTSGMPFEQAKETLSGLLYGQAYQQAAVMGIDDAFLWATIFAFVGFVLSFFIRDVRKKKTDLQASGNSEEENTSSSTTVTKDGKEAAVSV